MNSHYVGFLDAVALGIMIPIIAIAGPMAMGLVAIMQNHQRKMAEIIHGGKQTELVQRELDEMRAEIARLKSTVATQSLAIEGLAKRKSLSEANDTDTLSQRLG